jgi:hypothetical protein
MFVRASLDVLGVHPIVSGWYSLGVGLVLAPATGRIVFGSPMGCSDSKCAIVFIGVIRYCGPPNPVYPLRVFQLELFLCVDTSCTTRLLSWDACVVPFVVASCRP